MRPRPDQRTVVAMVTWTTELCCIWQKAIIAPVIDEETHSLRNRQTPLLANAEPSPNRTPLGEAIETQCVDSRRADERIEGLTSEIEEIAERDASRKSSVGHAHFETFSQQCRDVALPLGERHPTFIDLKDVSVRGCLQFRIA
jgi:hypothetical protein